MFTIDCEACGEDLMVDLHETSEDYYKDINYLINETGDIIEATLQKYLIYKCPLCKGIYKYTYKDWEERIRRKIAKEIMEVRKVKVFSEINPRSVNADHGLSFCGQCSGYAGDGSCLNDIITQCPIRKKDGV